MKIKAILILWVIFCCGFVKAQTPNTEKKMSDTLPNFTQKFDQLVVNDTTKVEIIEAPINPSEKTKVEVVLQYDKDKNYETSFVNKVICSNKIEAHRKLQFVKDALKDEGRNALKYVYSFNCSCLKEQAEIAALFSTYFYEQSKSSKDPHIQYRYLQFVTENDLPNGLQMIQQYFTDRPTLEVKYMYETKLPLFLIRKGLSKKALDLMEMFVEEQERGLIKYIKDGDNYERENIFALLSLEEDTEIGQKAIDLAFRYYLNTTRGYTYDLGLFLKYQDPSRYKDAIKLWFEKYENLDTTVYSNNNGYCSLLASDGRILAEEIGYAYWQKYLESKPRWKDANSTFENAMLDIALSCLKGNLQEEEKAAIVNYLLDNHRYLKEDESFKDSRVLDKFLEILFTINPQIAKGKAASYLPARYLEYGTWAYKFDALIEKQGQKNTEASSENVVDKFKEHGFLNNIELSSYDTFLMNIGRLNVHDLLQQTGRIIWFDTEGGMFPLDYTDLFENTIKPILTAYEVDYLSIDEKQLLEDGYCTYQISIKNKDTAYRIQFKNGSDWYEVKPFIKAINLALKDSGTPLRLVHIDSGDQTSLLGLFNPDRFIPLALDLNKYCFAVEYGDGFMSQNY